jgi:hypothetical protein
MSETQANTHAIKAAAFLIQALELDDDPASLAADVVTLKRDANAGISTLELESSVGPAAFLIYDYQLVEVNAEGDSGQALFDADLRTLERAAEADTPGPRILAHAIAGHEAFILATTPAVHRALTGLGPVPTLEADEGDLLPGRETARIRSEAANDLLRLLREADSAAQRWLRAIQAEGKLDSGADSGDFVEFGEAEAALALFVLDDRSIQHLLRALNLFVTSAKEQANQALNPEPNGSP